MRSARSVGTWVLAAALSAALISAHLRVSRGWAPLLDSVAHWRRCSGSTWAYDASGAPGDSDTATVTDLEVAFDHVEELTGLDFA